MAMRAADAAPSDVDRALGENQALIAAILEQQNAGRIVSASALLDRLQQNLAYVAAVAEARGREPGGPPPAPLLPLPAHRFSFAAAAPPARTAVALAPAGAVPAAPRPEGAAGRPWTAEENQKLEAAWAKFGTSGKDGRPNYKAIARAVGTRNAVQVRSHLHKRAKRRGREAAEAAAAPAAAQTAAQAGSQAGAQAGAKGAGPSATPIAAAPGPVAGAATAVPGAAVATTTERTEDANAADKVTPAATGQLGGPTGTEQASKTGSKGSGKAVSG